MSAVHQACHSVSGGRGIFCNLREKLSLRAILIVPGKFEKEIGLEGKEERLWEWAKAAFPDEGAQFQAYVKTNLPQQNKIW